VNAGFFKNAKPPAARGLQPLTPQRLNLSAAIKSQKKSTMKLQIKELLTPNLTPHTLHFDFTFLILNLIPSHQSTPRLFCRTSSNDDNSSPPDQNSDVSHLQTTKKR